jgi:hypothetical protein
MKARGDGRKPSLNFYTDERRIAFFYRAEFKTKKDECTEISISFSSFDATSFGRVVHGKSLDTSQVKSRGIMLSDRKAASFKLEIGDVSAKPLLQERIRNKHVKLVQERSA